MIDHLRASIAKGLIVLAAWVHPLAAVSLCMEVSDKWRKRP